MLKNIFNYSSPFFFRSVVSIFLVIPLTTKYLEVKDFGLFAVLNSIIAILTIVDCPANWVLTANFNKLRKNSKKIIFNLCLVNFINRFLIFFFSISLLFLIQDYFREILVVETVNFITILFLVFLFESQNQILSEILVLNQKSKIFFILQIFRTFLYLIFTYLLIKKDFGPYVLYIPTLFSSFILMLIEFAFLYKLVSIKIDFSIIQDIYSKLIKSISVKINDIATPFLNYNAINFFLGISYSGLFFHSQIYIVAIKNIQKGFTNSIYREYLNFLSKYKNNFSINYINNWLFFIFLLGVSISFFLEPFINIITHGKFNESAEYVIILFPSIYSLIYIRLSINTLLFHKDLKFLSNINYLNLLFNMVSVLILTYLFGIMGTCFGILIGRLIFVLFLRMRILKLNIYNIPIKFMKIFIYIIFNLIIFYFFSSYEFIFYHKISIFLVLMLLILYFNKRYTLQVCKYLFNVRFK